MHCTGLEVALHFLLAGALRPGGRLLVHDFMVNDSLDGPALGALWGLQHVTVNAHGLGLCPAEIIQRMGQAGFEQQKCEAHEMIQGMTKLIASLQKNRLYGIICLCVAATLVLSNLRCA
eukprot:s3853_g7.t1